jgi:DNA gyrase subunit A
VERVNLVLQPGIKIQSFKQLSVNTHTSVLFFSTEGLVYKVKAWKIPEGSTTSKGKSLFNILPLKNHQSISSIMPMPEDETDSKNYQIIFATAQGKVRKNSLEGFFIN